MNGLGGPDVPAQPMPSKSEPDHKISRRPPGASCRRTRNKIKFIFIVF